MTEPVLKCTGIKYCYSITVEVDNLSYPEAIESPLSRGTLDAVSDRLFYHYVRNVAGMVLSDGVAFERSVIYVSGVTNNNTVSIQYCTHICVPPDLVFEFLKLYNCQSLMTKILTYILNYYIK